MTASKPECICAVMAGGLGRRLGQAKATARLADRPLISYPLAAAEAAGLEPVVVAKPDSELPPLSVPIVPEPAEPHHPLCGIVAGLEEAERRGARAAVIIACDMPLLPPALIAWLAEIEESPALPLVGGHPQPLAARYATDLLPALRQALHPAGEHETGDSGRPDPAAADPHRIGALTAIVMGLEPRLLGESELAQFGDLDRIFHNINTTDDLQRASGWLPD